MPLKKKSLNEVAKQNTSVAKGKEILKEGQPLEHSIKHNVPNPNASVVGMNVGTTINMGDYQSLRVDCWLTDTVKENETQEQAFNRILGVIDKTLQDTVILYKTES